MNWKSSEIVRYVINGVIATAVHYFVLVLSVEFFLLKSTSISSMLASMFGIMISFMGNRYFVFRDINESIIIQAVKFTSLYSVIALLHGFTLYIWTDIYQHSYHIGFLIALSIQVLLGYIAGKNIVFKRNVISNHKLKKF